MGLLPDGAGWPMLLSTLAGLSTTLGGVIAILFKPSHESMAGLLGSAIGVMATVSIIELVIRNALQNNAFLVIASACGGALTYYVAEPLFPKVDEEQLAGKLKSPSASASVPSSAIKRGEMHTGAVIHRGQTRKIVPKRGKGAHDSFLQDDNTRHQSSSSDDADAASSPPPDSYALHIDTSTLVGESSTALDSPTSPSLMAEKDFHAQKSASLLRLGMLMAFTMTLHNLPEGFAVAFSALTDFGPIMAIAIAVHNIPEGIIIAAPIYAATGSRLKALGLATASGLSEPLGAFIALVALKSFLTQERLHYLLAFVGGIMLAVCVIELWPEARSCKNDRGLAWGIAIGSVVMAWTLYVGT